MIFLFLFFPTIISPAEIPLAPYNVKVFCRQGLRFTQPSQVAQQCPSSSTACGYLEFSFPHKNGLDSTGIFDCVESGMLQNSNSLDDEKDISEQPATILFSQLCGAQASCSSLSLERLNPAFYRYLITQHEVKLEEMRDTKIRFCCSLFHATLQKLIVSRADHLPTASASSMHCGGETCSAGAVGCLYHSIGSDDSEEYDDRMRQRRETDVFDYEINAVEISFDDEEEESSLVLVTREPSTTAITMNNKTQFLPSLNLPLVPPKPPTSIVKNGVKYAIIDDDSDESEQEEQHCVYRHLNDELYRWCLFVHQSKTGDRCYFHRGHTICCCFAPPDTETCDPTEMELVVPGKKEVKLPPPIRVTPRPVTSSTTTSSTTSTSTTTTTTTTPPPTTTTTSAPSTVPRCRITYVKHKGRNKVPVLVCGCQSFFSIVGYFLLLLCFFL